MELIIGGRAQGKLAYACQLSGLTKEQAANHRLDGQKAMINHFETYIREQLMEYQELSDSELTAQIVNQVMNWSDSCPDGFIICDEVGSGIVPMDKFERRYRELTGRTLCELVKRSRKVHRVFSGIGVVIKDA